MNNDIIDHVAALILDAINRRGGTYSGFDEELTTLVEQTYGLRFSPELLIDALGVLKDLGGVQILPSSLAGNMLNISVGNTLQYYDIDAPTPSDRTTVEYDNRYNMAHEKNLPIKSYYFGRDAWIARVVASLSKASVSGIEPMDEVELGVIAPASDRIVTLSHNQQNELDEAAEEVRKALTTENSIDGDVALRERLLAQIAASRELFRAQTVRAYLVYETLFRMLGALITKYKDQALGTTARRLLELLVEHVIGK